MYGHQCINELIKIQFEHQDAIFALLGKVGNRIAAV